MQWNTSIRITNNTSKKSSSTVNSMVDHLKGDYTQVTDHLLEANSMDTTTTITDTTDMVQDLEAEVLIRMAVIKNSQGWDILGSESGFRLQDKLCAFGLVFGYCNGFARVL